MRQYHWKFVGVRDLLALLAALFWSLLDYTQTWSRKLTCEPAWHGFLSFLALILAVLILIEMFRWVIWNLQGAFQQGDSPFLITEDSTPSVLINRTDLKTGFLNAAAGLLLTQLAIYLGGPTPCELPRLDVWSWPIFLGCIICGFGLLTIANGVVREEKTISR